MGEYIKHPMMEEEEEIKDGYAVFDYDEPREWGFGNNREQG